MRKAFSLIASILIVLSAVPGAAAGKYAEYKADAAFQSEKSLELKADQAVGGVAVVEDKTAGTVLSLDEGDSATWELDIQAEGNYWFTVTYMALADTYDPISVDLLIDGALPFEESAGLPLERSWVNGDADKYDIHGNQIRPDQLERQMWRSKTLRAVDASAGDLEYFLTAGRHTITLTVTQERCLIKEVTVRTVTRPATYAQTLASYQKLGYRDANAENIELEAEGDSVKSSQSLYPVADRSSPSVTPYSPQLIYYNTVGGTQWETAGQWIEWSFKIEKDGLYEFAFHFKQSDKADAVSVRELYIDNALPFAEAASINFPYTNDWDMLKCGYTDGKEFVPYKFYLTTGEHTLRLQVGLGAYQEILDQTDALITKLNSVYRHIVVVTGVTPDYYADYELDKTIPEVLTEMERLSKQLKQLEESIRALGFSGNQGTDAVKRLYNQLDWMLEDTDTVAKRLTTYRDAISSLGTWRNSLAQQPLTLDMIYVTSEGNDLPSGKSSLLKRILHQIQQFLYSYVSDYSSIGEISENADRNITVWMNSGRDQAQILKSLISQQFTPRESIAVNLQLVAAESLLPALLAGTGPDVTIGLTQAEPVNLALREALVDLKSFPDYEEVSSWFYEQSIVPFCLGDGVYALPNTLSYMMLFYRADVLEELHISTDELSEWNSLLQKVLPVVQKSGLTVGIPATSTTYLSMLYQMGGDMYLENNTVSGLGSAEAIQAMGLFEKLYSQYNLAIAFDAANRFRSGEMPLVINDYLFYNQLTLFAPEISGAWGMLPMPGVKKADGSIDQTSVSTVTGTAIMRAAKDTNACWNFVKWWLSADVQTAYGRDLESVVGTAARYNTANIEAMDTVKWAPEISEQLQAQRLQLRAFVEVPGGYLTEREYNFAFRKIVYHDKQIRLTMNEAAENINSELLRKRQEYGLAE